ncbi:MAG: alpha-amylase [Candidatus Omnitrophica bacterium]|nr:alpha-amylase [Candidatus Omnitrophota bacterium]
MRKHPHLFEVHALRWLNSLSNQYNKRLTLSTVPDQEWKRLTDLGFEFVWLMGVWKRSPAALHQALTIPSLRHAYSEIFPQWAEKDIAGSPYAIYEYSLDPALGKKGELKELKKKLNHMGLGLILDFVPNHLAMDHPWTISHPGRFVSGTESDSQEHVDWFFKTPKGNLFAYGRDPNFPPWSDTVQVNFFSAEMRKTLTEELLHISECCDGVRCDMAMLGLNRVFERVWGNVLKNHPRLKEEFWPEAISQVKSRHKNFLFIAEVYWGLEGALQEMGFDYAYDKTLYDRVRYETASQIQNHLQTEDLYYHRALRFIENHDEPRSANVFGPERARATAVILSTVPGMRLFYDGQMEGKTVQLPITLVREPRTAADGNMVAFYEKLLRAVKQEAYHAGEWRILEIAQASQNNISHQHLLAWSWSTDKDLKIVIINYSRVPSQGRLKIPHFFPAVNGIKFSEEITGKKFYFAEQDLYQQGMAIDMEPWEYQLLSREE